METNNKLRETMLSIRADILKRRSENVWYITDSDILEKINSALAEPVKNCEVGTAEEQSERFDKFCHENINVQRCCGDCPAFRTTRDDCELVWAQLPYKAKKGGAK